MAGQRKEEWTKHSDNCKYYIDMLYKCEERRMKEERERKRWCLLKEKLCFVHGKRLDGKNERRNNGSVKEIAIPNFFTTTLQPRKEETQSLHYPMLDRSR